MWLKWVGSRRSYQCSQPNRVSSTVLGSIRLCKNAPLLSTVLPSRLRTQRSPRSSHLPRIDSPADQILYILGPFHLSLLMLQRGIDH